MAKKKFLVDIDLNQNELQFPKIHNLASDPAGPTSGQTYFNTTDGNMYMWDGTVWVDLTAGSTQSTDIVVNDPLTITQSGGTFTIGINATSSNTPGFVVQRDASGNFSGGVITADTVTGLTAPSLGTDATNKEYVDTLVSGIQQSAVEVADPLTVTQSGITYSIGINATSSNVANFVVQRDANGSFEATMVTGLTAPSLGTDAANKNYVDALVQGLDPKESCRVIATASITLSGTQSIDGVTLAVGERVLVAGQGGDLSTPDSANGIYDVAVGAWTRSEDADGTPASEVSAGMYTFVTEGTTYADTGWVLATNDPITVDTTPLQFVQFSQAGVITAGDGLVQVGSIFNVGAGNGITVNTNDVEVTAGTGITVDSSGVNVDGASLSGDGLTWDNANGEIDVVAGTGITVDSSGVNVDGASLAGTGVNWNNATGQFEVTGGGVTDVTAGAGLTANGTTGSVTLDVSTANGLSILNDSVALGGTLSQNTTVNGGDNSMVFTNMGTFSVNANSGDVTMFSDSGDVSLITNGVSNFNVRGNGNIDSDYQGTFIITDSSGNGLGVQYAADYSATFVTNSLVSKQYVDTAIAASGDITEVIAGAGLTGGGDTGAVTLDVGAGTGIIVNTDTIELDGNSISGNGLTWSGTQLDINAGAGLTVSASTLSALTDGSTIQTNLSGELEVVPNAFPTKYTETGVVLGNTPGPQTVTHNLNTLFVNVTVYDESNGEEVTVEIDHTTANDITLDANGPTFGVSVTVIG